MSETEKMSRRGFLTALGMFTLGLAAETVYKNNKLFFDLVMDRVKKGEAIDSIRKLVDSTLTPEQPAIYLGKKLDYQPSWADFTDSTEIFEVAGSPDKKIAVIDVTHSTNVCKVETQEINGYPSFDLAATMAEHGDFLCLPRPHVETNNQDYSMYFGVNEGGKILNYGTREKSKVRPVMVLSEGTLIAATPAEAEALTADNTHTMAFETGFYLESETIAQDLEYFNSTFTESGKKIGGMQNWSSIYTTVYKPDGSFKTLVITPFQTIDPNIKTTTWGMTISQIASLVTDYMAKEGYVRFVTVLPDPSGKSTVISPTHFSHAEVEQYGLSDVTRETYGTQEQQEKTQLFETSGATIFDNRFEPVQAPEVGPVILVSQKRR